MARKSRSERNCSGFFLCRGIIKRCTPLGSKCTPHRPFVKWYRGVKRNRLYGDHFRITVEPGFVKWYRETVVNQGFSKDIRTIAHDRFSAIYQTKQKQYFRNRTDIPKRPRTLPYRLWVLWQQACQSADPQGLLYGSFFQCEGTHMNRSFHLSKDLYGQKSCFRNHICIPIQRFFYPVSRSLSQL